MSSVRWVCLGVGINNFATGRMATTNVLAAVAPLLESVDGEVVGSFGATGNLVVEAPAACPVSSIQAALRRATSRDWAVVTSTSFSAALGALERLPAPERRDGARWTPGLSFCIGDPVGSPSSRLDLSDAGVFTPISVGIVGVFKHDVENGHGRLDPNRRRGGWGGVSAILAKQVGGTWTSRAVSTLRGLERLARS